MTVDLQLAAFAVALTWVMVVSAGMLKSRSWSPAGLKAAVGNRDSAPVPNPAWVDRADRAAKNMLENLPLFLGLVAIAHLGGRHTSRVDLGAHLFFWARVVYWPIYLAGIPVLRTVVWSVSILGLALIFTALL
jgi:uncharacterized MAPEG superfamily protein